MSLKLFEQKLRRFLKFWGDSFIFCLQVLLKRPSATVLLCISSPDSVGGTEFQVNQIAEQWVKLGERPLILTLGKIKDKKNHLFLKRLKAQKIPYLHMGSLGLSKKSLPLRFAALFLKGYKARVCQFFNPASANLIPAAKKAKLKIYYMEMGLPRQDPWWEPLTAHIHSIDLVIAVSRAGLQNLRSNFGYTNPGAIFYSLIDPPPPGLLKQPARTESLQVVYFGRICPGKGVHYLLEAFKTLLLKYPSAHLTLIGEGPLKPTLEQQAIQWDIEKQVLFLGFQKKEDLLRQLATFDLFCLPSLSEGAPCSILEAMSIGLPVLASCVGGIPEIIEDRVSGLLVPPKDSRALAEALLFLANDPALRHKMGMNGLKRYEEHFSSQDFPSSLL